MLRPVYGYEEYYSIDENGKLYGRTGKLLKPNKDVPQRPSYRLNDKKRHFAEDLLVSSGFYTLQEDEFLFYLDGDLFNTNYDNMVVLNKKTDKIKMLEQHTKQRVSMVNEFYFVTENGDLYSMFKQKIKLVKPYLRPDGYYEVYYQENNIRHVKKVHRLVAEHFCTKKEGCDIVNHIDGVKTNNHYSNLEWTTSFLNNEHAKQMGLNNGTFGEAKKACLVGKHNEIILVSDSIAQLAEQIGKDSSTASKQTRGIKNRYADGTRVRLFDEENNTFIPTKFD